MGNTYNVFPASFNFMKITYALLCHANKHLNCRIVNNFNLICVCRNSILLNLYKLHCIIIAMSYIHASHDHADSFAVVVSMHPLFVVAFCFFSDRTLRGVVSNNFFRCSSTISPGKLSRPLSTYRGTYYLFVFMLYSLC
jgi:hypothetical protein